MFSSFFRFLESENSLPVLVVLGIVSVILSLIISITCYNIMVPDLPPEPVNAQAVCIEKVTKILQYKDADDLPKDVNLKTCLKFSNVPVLTSSVAN